MIRIQPSAIRLIRLSSLLVTASDLVSEVPAVAASGGDVTRPGGIGGTVFVFERDPGDTDGAVGADEGGILRLYAADGLAKGVVCEVAGGDVAGGYTKTVRNWI